MDKQSQQSLAGRLKRRIDDGCTKKIGDGKGEYPPFKVASWDNRAAYRQYVFDCIDEVLGQ